MIVFLQILRDSNLLGSCMVGLALGYAFLICVLKMLSAVKIWPVLAVWKISDLTIYVSVKILYKSMFVIGKCFTLLDRKWFFTKYNLGMGLSQIADGRKLAPYVTLLCITAQTRLLLFNIATCYFSLLWSL